MPLADHDQAAVDEHRREIRFGAGQSSCMLNRGRAKGRTHVRATVHPARADEDVLLSGRSRPGPNREHHAKSAPPTEPAADTDAAAQLLCRLFNQ